MKFDEAGNLENSTLTAVSKMPCMTKFAFNTNGQSIITFGVAEDSLYAIPWIVRKFEWTGNQKPEAAQKIKSTK